MGQTIYIQGASYADVPALRVPKSTGDSPSYASFYDTTDANAAASDIASGKTAYVNGEKLVGTASGGGGAIVIEDSTDAAGGTVREITAVDISEDTVTAAVLHTGYTAHDADGELVEGAYTPPTARSGSDVTVSGDTVTVPAGAYSSQVQKSVAAGTAGTPTATKGTVSNHSVSVTPSVTNQTGYITGSTKTGTAVTVSASELVSGSETKTANGTYDVTNLAQLIVNVSGGGGSGLTYETGTYTPTSNIARPTISFTNSHSTFPIFVGMYDTSAASSITSSSNLTFVYFDVYAWTAGSFPYSTSASRYAVAYYSYRSSNSTSSSGATVAYSNANTSTESSSYSRYWVTTSAFYPYTGSASRYWRSGRTYKWIAVWGP